MKIIIYLNNTYYNYYKVQKNSKMPAKNSIVRIEHQIPNSVALQVASKSIYSEDSEQVCMFMYRNIVDVEHEAIQLCMHQFSDETISDDLRLSEFKKFCKHLIDHDNKTFIKELMFHNKLSENDLNIFAFMYLTCGLNNIYRRGMFAGITTLIHTLHSPHKTDLADCLTLTYVAAREFEECNQLTYSGNRELAMAVRHDTQDACSYTIYMPHDFGVALYMRFSDEFGLYDMALRMVRNIKAHIDDTYTLLDNTTIQVRNMSVKVRKTHGEYVFTLNEQLLEKKDIDVIINDLMSFYNFTHLFHIHDSKERVNTVLRLDMFRHLYSMSYEPEYESSVLDIVIQTHDTFNTTREYVTHLPAALSCEYHKRVKSAMQNPLGSIRSCIQLAFSIDHYALQAYIHMADNKDMNKKYGEYIRMSMMVHTECKFCDHTHLRVAPDVDIHEKMQRLLHNAPDGVCVVDCMKTLSEMDFEKSDDRFAELCILREIHNVKERSLFSFVTVCLEDFRNIYPASSAGILYEAEKKDSAKRDDDNVDTAESAESASNRRRKSEKMLAEALEDTTTEGDSHHNVNTTESASNRQYRLDGILAEVLETENRNNTHDNPENESLESTNNRHHNPEETEGSNSTHNDSEDKSSESVNNKHHDSDEISENSDDDTESKEEHKSDHAEEQERKDNYSDIYSDSTAEDINDGDSLGISTTREQTVERVQQRIYDHYSEVQESQDTYNAPQKIQYYNNFYQFFHAGKVIDDQYRDRDISDQNLTYTLRDALGTLHSPESAISVVFKYVRRMRADGTIDNVVHARNDMVHVYIRRGGVRTDTPSFIDQCPRDITDPTATLLSFFENYTPISERKLSTTLSRLHLHANQTFVPEAEMRMKTSFSYYKSPNEIDRRNIERTKCIDKNSYEYIDDMLCFASLVELKVARYGNVRGEMNLCLQKMCAYYINLKDYRDILHMHAQIRKLGISSTFFERTSVVRYNTLALRIKTGDVRKMGVYNLHLNGQLLESTGATVVLADACAYNLADHIYYRNIHMQNDDCEAAALESVKIFELYNALSLMASSLREPLQIKMEEYIAKYYDVQGKHTELQQNDAFELAKHINAYYYCNDLACVAYTEAMGHINYFRQ